jgi:hypothetical protein
MAYGEQFSAASPLAYTIHVWPTAELAARSWSWPERRRQNFAHVAWMLALAAATQILKGGSFVKQDIKVPTIFGRVTFTIAQTGNTVHITISEFSGPHAPGPNGGLGKQPACIGGLVLGLRGSNRYFHLVRFLGTIPATPYFTSYEQDTHIQSVFNSGVDVAISKAFYPEQIPELAFPKTNAASVARNGGTTSCDVFGNNNDTQLWALAAYREQLHPHALELNAPTRQVLSSVLPGVGDMTDATGRIDGKQINFLDRSTNIDGKECVFFGSDKTMFPL